MSTQDKFTEAGEWLKANTKLVKNEEDLLPSYSYFKQATEGDNTTAEPMRLNIRKHRKWAEWKSRSGMSKEEAMEKYVESVEALKAKYAK